MKKTSLWAGIIGIVLVVLYLIILGNSIANPKDLIRVNIANDVTDIAWIIFGVFLIVIFLNAKKAQDAGIVPVKHEPNSPVDIERLRIRRNWILSFVMLVAIILSFAGWIMNNYGAGPTLINIETVFDIVLNVVLFYMAIRLLRDKKNTLNTLFFIFIFYFVAEAIMEGIRHDWFSLASELLFLLYFIYAIKAPLNRANHRTAHLIILPIVIVLVIVCSTLSDAKIGQLIKNEATLQQEFNGVNAQLAGDYSTFLQESNPSAANIQGLQNDVTHNQTLYQQTMEAINQLEAAYKAEPSSIGQAEALEHLEKVSFIMNLAEEQLNDIQQLIDYDKNIDFNNLTAKQAAFINSIIQAVSDLWGQINAAQVKLNNN